MAMFTFYGDESYGNIDAYAVAGYIATVGQWTELAREWRALGAREGFTILHKRELEHNLKKTDFEWPNLTIEEKQEKKKRINNLACKTILRRVNAGFCAAVTKSVWESTVAQSRWAGLLGKSFYAAGVYVCMNLIALWLQQSRREPVDGIRYILRKAQSGAMRPKSYLEKLRKTRIFVRDTRCKATLLRTRSILILCRYRPQTFWPMKHTGSLITEL